MPVKPWALGPKKSLNIFGGLGEVLDARAERQQAAVEQQQRLEDRLAQKEMRDLQKRSLEQALAEAAKPKPVKPNRTYDAKRGKVIDLDAGRVLDLGLPAMAEDESPVSWQTVETDRGMVQVNPRTGQTRPLGIRPPAKVQAEPKDPTLTDGERKGAAFMHRVIPSGQAINQFDNRKTLDEVASKMPVVGNWITTPRGRQLRQAGKEWVMSVLRPESGATIQDSELDSYFETYLPRPGDDDTTLAMKRAARRRAEESIGIMAGRALPKGSFTSAIQADSAAAANRPPSADRSPLTQRLTDPAAFLRSIRGGR